MKLGNLKRRERSRSFPTNIQLMSIFMKGSNLIFQILFFLFFFEIITGFSDRSSFSQSDFWQQTNGPTGGTVYSLAVNSSGDIFAGTQGSGIFRSTDNGENWIQLGLAEEWIQTMTCLPNGDILAGGSHGVYRSQNNGLTWEQILFIDTTVRALAFNAKGYIFAGSNVNDFPSNDGRLFRSTDNGATWIRTETGLRGHGVSSILCYNGEILAGTFTETVGAGVYRSTNDGDSWQQTSLTNTILNSLINAAGVIFAGTWNGVFRSDDGGDSWQQINEGLTDTTILCLAGSSTGAVFASTYGGVFRLIDTVWTPIDEGLTTRHILNLAINADDDIFAASDGDGIYRSTDGGDRWSQINSGLINTQIKSLAINSDGDLFAGTDVLYSIGKGVFRSTDNGDSWIESGLTEATVNSIVINNNCVIFAGSQGGKGVLRSTDNGLNWLEVGLQNTIVNMLVLNADDDIFAATFDGVYHSTEGDTWTPTALPKTVVRSLAINSAGEIFAVTPQTVFRTSDNGNTWTQTGLSNTTILSIAINAIGDIFVGTVYESGIYRSTDNGVTWSQTGLRDASLVVSALTTYGQDNIFAATNKGVYSSTDNGDNWSQINDGLMIPSVRCLSLNQEGYIFAGSGGAGVFRSIQPISSFKPTPSNFQLVQNYPNPFNPATTIQYILPKKVSVTITIYNILGKRVRTLLDGEIRKGGFYEVEWDGKDDVGSEVASGVYFYRLEAAASSTERFVQSHKMTLLR